MPTALERAQAQFAPDRVPAAPVVVDGYLDLLGPEDPTGARLGQRLMLSRHLSLVYQRWWRPLFGRVLMGLAGPDADGERRLVAEMLALADGDAVLDVACGPGNFTADFAHAAGDGFAVGLDASAAMLAEAARANAAVNVAYLRGDATALPFRDRSFDAVCCLAALYLIERPLDAVAEIARVLAPGGRVALLSSVHRGPLPPGPADRVVRGLTGVRVFARDELTGALREHGLVDVRQRVSGLAQFVSARRPA
jgi:SAM-dependent methyltransferase